MSFIKTQDTSICVLDLVQVCSSQSEKKTGMTTWELQFRTLKKLQFTARKKLR